MSNSQLNSVDVKTAAGSTINKLNNHATANRLAFSSDFTVRKTTQGTHIGIKPQHKQAFEGVHYQFELDPTRSYAMFDVINVFSGSTYSITGSQISASIGTWVCVVPVPAFNYSSSQQNEMRQVGVNYAPVSPIPSALANPWATDSTAMGRYWEPFGTAATQSIYRWYKQEYDSSAHYIYGDVVTLHTGTTQGIFICVNDTGSISGIAPVYPVPLTGAVWHVFNLGIKTFSVCNGGSKSEDIPATAPY